MNRTKMRGESTTNYYAKDKRTVTRDVKVFACKIGNKNGEFEQVRVATTLWDSTVKFGDSEQVMPIEATPLVMSRELALRVAQWIIEAANDKEFLGEGNG